MSLSPQGLLELQSSGVSYPLQYIGFVPVLKSAREIQQDECDILFQYVADALCALRDNGIIAQPNEIVTIVGTPKLVDIPITFKISSKMLLAVHDDKCDSERYGKVIHRHPMKYTAMIQLSETRKEYFAYIAKNSKGANRKCCLYAAKNPIEAHRVMDTLEEALRMSIPDDLNEPTPSNQFQFEFDPPLSHDAPTPPPRTRGHGTLHAELIRFPWYHGVIDRTVTSERLHEPGDFLVRESNQIPGQIVLSGIAENGKERHILLVNTNGEITTDEMEFPAIEALINYYLSNKVEIHMNGRAQLLLRRPILRDNS